MTRKDNVTPGYRRATRTERRRLWHELAERPKMHVEVLDFGEGRQTYIIYREPLPRGRPRTRVVRREA